MTYSRSENLTVSSAQTFKRCPFQFYLKFIEGREESGLDTTARDRGTQFHKWVAAQNDGPEVRAELALGIGDLIDAFERLYDADKLPDIGPVMHIFFEREFQRDGFAGTADLTMDGHGFAIIRDWKTGFYGMGKIADDLQLGFYGHMLSAPGDVVILEKWWIAKEIIQRLETTHEGCKWAYDVMVETLTAVADAQDSGVWPAKPGSACAMCGVRRFCSAWQLPALPGEVRVTDRYGALELARLARLATAKLDEIKASIREFVEVNGPLHDEDSGETLDLHVIKSKELDVIGAVRAMLDNGVQSTDILERVKLTKTDVTALCRGNKAAKDAALACVTETEKTRLEWR